TTIRGERGQHYRVWHDGAVLLEDTWNPEFEACRALLARGIKGKLQTWRRGRQHWDMQLDIERGAGLTVEENERHGRKIVRWRPRLQDGVSWSAGRAPAAELQPVGGRAAKISRSRRGVGGVGVFFEWNSSSVDMPATPFKPVPHGLGAGRLLAS